LVPKCCSYVILSKYLDLNWVLMYETNLDYVRRIQIQMSFLSLMFARRRRIGSDQGKEPLVENKSYLYREKRISKADFLL